MALPPAINLDPSNFSKMHHTTSRSSEEEEERESPDGGALDEQHHHHSSATGAGAPLTTGKRPRGRPPGSKNKPKTPTYVSVDPQDTLRPHILEVASGADIASCLATYARTRGRGVSVLYAVGSVAGVTVRHHNPSSSSPNNSVFLKGKQDIVALSGTVLPDNTPLGPATLTVLVAGPHGQLIGGPVEGRIVAEGSVMVMATTFATATYEKLPLLQEVAVAPASSGLGGMDHHHSGPPADPDPVYRPHPQTHTHTHPGLNMNVNMNMGIGTQPPPPPPETNSSYANWFLQQQVHSNNGRPPLYINNNS